MLSLIVYVPREQSESLKNALFKAGAGRIGNYDSCCFEIAGRGQFRPLSGSNPHVGQHDSIEVVEEHRLEMVCSPDLIRQVIAALKEAHPYETPAYHVLKCEAY